MRISIPVFEIRLGFLQLSGKLTASVVAGLLLYVFLQPTQAVASTFSDDALVQDVDNPRNAKPGPQLTPGAVVRLQMLALGNNEEWGDNKGIQVAFRFASPGNRKFTGPIDRFIGLLQNPVYAPMLDYKSIEYAATRSEAADAVVPVLVTQANGERAGYLFVLSRQDDEECACWMTERVSRVELGDDGAPSGTAI